MRWAFFQPRFNRLPCASQRSLAVFCRPFPASPRPAGRHRANAGQPAVTTFSATARWLGQRQQCATFFVCFDFGAVGFRDILCLPLQKERSLGKLIYLVYGIVALGALALGGYLVMSHLENTEQASSCLRLQGAAQDKCLREVMRKEEVLSSMVKGVLPSN